jgi:tetratricopeptide (TPR) repeat protein
VLRSWILLLIVLCGTSSAQDLDGALAHARELVGQHRYQEIIELLSPFEDLEDPEARYVVAAEIGRAHFHLGDYAAADEAFRTAVSLRPQRVESALYLEATSYLTGNREQAYAILREILRGNPTDLYLAVSLPGERLFLADPAVWAILEDHAEPLPMDLDRGAVLGVEIGQPQTEVEQRLGTGPTPHGSALTARAGPYLIWAFGFDDARGLAQIMLHNEHLIRYTPYRLELVGDLDWRATPEVSTRALGAPASTATGDGGFVVMVWDRDELRLTMEFAPPRAPAPPGFDPEKPALRVLRLEVAEQPDDGGGDGQP